MGRAFAWLIVFVSSSHDTKEVTDRMVPRAWTWNAWGPAANVARAAGVFPPIVMTPAMKRWDTWGRTVLKQGDILFRLGDARVLYGLFPFSRFTANASGSKFSHTAVVAIESEGEGPVVYDITRPGVRRQPFAIWILNNVGPFGVKRLRAEFRSHIPQVIRFCREVYFKQVPFDKGLGLDDETLYCTEMTEKAFRSSGLALSEPIPLGDMENATQFPICMFFIASFTRLKLEQRLFFPGNERHGIWGSPLLELVWPPVERQASDRRVAAGTFLSCTWGATKGPGNQRKIRPGVEGVRHAWGAMCGLERGDCVGVCRSSAGAFLVCLDWSDGRGRPLGRGLLQRPGPGGRPDFR